MDLDIKMQMSAILELEKEWQKIKSSPSNIYSLPPNPNGNMLAGINLNKKLEKTQPKIDIDFVSPAKRQLNALSKMNSQTNSHKILDAEDFMNTDGIDLGKSEIAKNFFDDNLSSTKK